MAPNRRDPRPFLTTPVAYSTRQHSVSRSVPIQPPTSSAYLNPTNADHGRPPPSTLSPFASILPSISDSVTSGIISISTPKAAQQNVAVTDNTPLVSSVPELQSDQPVIIAPNSVSQSVTKSSPAPIIQLASAQTILIPLALSMPLAAVNPPQRPRRPKHVTTAAWISSVIAGCAVHPVVAAQPRHIRTNRLPHIRRRFKSILRIRSNSNGVLRFKTINRNRQRILTLPLQSKSTILNFPSATYRKLANRPAVIVNPPSTCDNRSIISLRRAGKEATLIVASANALSAGFTRPPTTAAVPLSITTFAANHAPSHTTNNNGHAPIAIFPPRYEDCTRSMFSSLLSGAIVNPAKFTVFTMPYLPQITKDRDESALHTQGRPFAVIGVTPNSMKSQEELNFFITALFLRSGLLLSSRRTLATSLNIFIPSTPSIQ